MKLKLVNVHKFSELTDKLHIHHSYVIPILHTCGRIIITQRMC
uniref:Uncharacterized protein n=1 Tax=Arundo donax TaxID=35708 RepID=A0A0A8Z5V0_ARUDO